MKMWGKKWGGTNIPLPPQAKKWGGTCPPCPPASYASGRSLGRLLARSSVTETPSDDTVTINMYDRCVALFQQQRALIAQPLKLRPSISGNGGFAVVESQKPRFIVKYGLNGKKKEAFIVS